MVFFIVVYTSISAACIYLGRFTLGIISKRVNFVPPLPETRRMPSAEGFAECTISSNTRRKKTLPSASHVALGKATLCRVPKSRHSANAPLPSAAWAALGNKCHVRHTSPHTPVTTGPPLFFAECLTVCTRQRQSRAPHTTVTPLPPCCHERYTVRRPLPL